MPNILVIDDDPEISQLLESHLGQEGYAVKVAQRGDEGIMEATKATPDLILLDVMLPDATGFQICSRLRKLAEIQHVPIIMMSGVACYPNQKMFAMERGANEYLVKPLEIIEVGELVNSYLRKNWSPVTRGEDPIAKAAEAAVPDPASDNPALEEADVQELRSFLMRAMERWKDL